MAEQKECQCQSAAHGHRPGKSPHPAVDDGSCKECNEENASGRSKSYWAWVPLRQLASAHEAAITRKRERPSLRLVVADRSRCETKQKAPLGTGLSLQFGDFR